MKKSLVLSALFISLPCYSDLAPQKGVKGELSLNTGITSTASNFNAEGDATISSIENKAQSESEALVAPLGNIAYTFGELLNHQIYFGTAREDIAVGTLALQLGYKHELDSGTIVNVSFLPTVMSGKTWQDPYQTGVARIETDETGNAYRLKLEEIAATRFSLDLAYATNEIEIDAYTGSNLARNGYSYYGKGEYRFMLSPTSFVTPSATYIHHEADGKANSYNSYGADVSWFNIFDRHNFVLTAGYAKRGYDSASIVFDKKRSDDEFSFFAAYEYANFMEWQGWSLISFAGYGSTQSNITFYDESEYIV
ncbi:MAG: DUF2860 domain-containing protein, partial [Gammaproteobacteria bacterium]|nr:DUF2860 domain-containing protein [Gammaproteobacteria bacterium]